LLSVRNTVKQKRVRASSSPSAKFEHSNSPYKTEGCVFRSPFFVRSRIVADAVCVDVMV
jgi:hypothetical protein